MCLYGRYNNEARPTDRIVILPARSGEQRRVYRSTIREACKSVFFTASATDTGLREKGRRCLILCLPLHLGSVHVCSGTMP